MVRNPSINSSMTLFMALREDKAAVLAYLRGRAQPQGNRFVSLSDPIARKTEKLESSPKTKDSASARKSVALCGSPHCAGCYEVAPGVRVHPPKCGEEYRVWLERWEARSRLQ